VKKASCDRRFPSTLTALKTRSRCSSQRSPQDHPAKQWRQSRRHLRSAAAHFIASRAVQHHDDQRPPPAPSPHQLRRRLRERDGLAGSRWISWKKAALRPTRRSRACFRGRRHAAGVEGGLGGGGFAVIWDAAAKNTVLDFREVAPIGPSTPTISRARSSRTEEARRDVQRPRRGSPGLTEIPPSAGQKLPLADVVPAPRQRGRQRLLSASL
jgi:hypothetical protein